MSVRASQITGVSIVLLSRLLRRRSKKIELRISEQMPGLGIIKLEGQLFNDEFYISYVQNFNYLRIIYLPVKFPTN